MPGIGLMHGDVPTDFLRSRDSRLWFQRRIEGANRGEGGLYPNFCEAGPLKIEKDRDGS